MIFNLFLVLSLLGFAQSEPPKKTTEDGVYYYNTTPKKSIEHETKHGKAIETPSGAYLYDTSDIEAEDKKAELKNGGDGSSNEVQKIKGKVYIYEAETSEQKNSVTIQYISNKFEDFTSNNSSFQSVYDNSKGLLVDYEWQFKTKLGRFGLIFNSGLLFSSGDGTFSGVNAGLKPKEGYDLYIVPITAKVRYNLEMFNTQYVVPYIEGGGGLMALLERRDDGDENTRAYSPVITFGGGLAFLLDWMMGTSIKKMDNDWGINHMWFVVSLQSFIASDKDYDLSDTQMAAGFKVDF